MNGGKRRRAALASTLKPIDEKILRKLHETKHFYPSFLATPGIRAPKRSNFEHFRASYKWKQ